MKKQVKGKGRARVLMALLLIAALALSIGIIMASASETVVTVGEMAGDDGIAKVFEKYLVQDVVRADDEYVGSIQYSAYYDTSKGAIKTGYEGTPVVIYSVNHPGIERIGTDSNETIISSMLERGYVVVILDYLNNAEAVSPAIDWSSQNFRADLRNGKILKSSVFPSGGYDENFLAPSGFNVLLNEVFWEIDKHSAAGSLEKIVENWNSDFRATKGTKFIEWVHEDGSRKAVQKDFDGNAPVWYDANKNIDQENGTYTYVKWTKAEVITDCVDPDGSFIDMNLYINIVYPTSPAKEVPVMSLANSSGYPTTSVTGKDSRPHSNGFLYNGYANVVFDYLWMPMARNASWGYYDGSGGVTQDHMNYAIMMYNDKLVNTAAMRYLRYLSVSGGDTYNFDLDAFGVYGNSKGGWFTFLGEQVVQSPLAGGTYASVEEKQKAIDLALAAFTPDRYFNGYHGQTRYQNGEGVITGDGFTIKAGTLQPWLTYDDGTEIISGCQFTYASNGSQQEDMTKGHSPVFVASHMFDDYNAAYGFSNDIVNICRELDIPLLNFEVPLGHTLTHGIDMNYGTDTYVSFFDYVNYYLNGGDLKVSYIHPLDGAGAVKVTDKITVRFAGAVSADEITKVTVTAGDAVLEGSWASEFGGTLWIFTPSSMVGGTKYTVTVPKGLKGRNGNTAAADYTSTFITEADVATAITELATDAGNYYTFTAPAMTFGNSFVFRFSVTNDAANIAELYAVNDATSTDGTLLGSINLRGVGSYEIDVTDYIAARAGESVTLLLRAKNASGKTVVIDQSFDSEAPSSLGSRVTFVKGASIDGRTALQATVTGKVSKDVSVYYDNTTHIFTYGKVTGGEKTIADNLGRKYTFTIDIYDTISRTVQFKLNSMTKRVDYGTIDYDNVFFSAKTVANEWVTYEFTYVVYENDYGKPSLSNVQSLAVYASPDGDTESPLYFDNFKVTETVTDIEVGEAFIAEKDDGTGAYVAPVSTSPIALYNGSEKVGEYASLSAAFASYKSGYTVTLQSDYTLTDSGLYNGFGSFEQVVIDLGGYTLRMENTKNSLIWAKATGTLLLKTSVTVKNGSILLGRTPLVSYEDSQAAGDGKSFAVSFTNVVIGLLDGSMTSEIASALTSTSGVQIDSDITFTDCVFDLPDANHAYDAITVLPESASSALDISYSVYGGSFRFTSQRWITVLSNSNVAEFFEGKDGFTTLTLSTPYEPAATSYIRSDGYAVYANGVQDEAKGLTTYTLYKSEYSTKYGVIDSKYADEVAYPYAVFMDGNFKGAYSAWNSATSAAAALVKGSSAAGKTAYLLVRTNAEAGVACSPLNGIGGTLVIDLGGNTLTRGKLILDLSPNSTDASLYFETNIIVKNGEIRTPGGTPCATQSWTSAKQVDHKVFSVVFDEVTFGSSAGATGMNIWTVWANSATDSKGTTTNLTFNNCTFDLSTNYPTTKDVKVLDFVGNDSYKADDFNVTINGGKILGKDLSKTIFYTKDAEDKVVVGRGSDGNYPVLEMVSGGAPLTDNFVTTSEENMSYVIKEDDGTKAVYYLEVNPNATDYGVISSAYADADKYPFALFDENGNFIGAYTHFMNTADSDATADAKDVLQPAKSLIHGSAKANVKAYIVLRRDYTLGETGVTEAYNNLSQIGGTLIIDLDGHTLTTANKPLFDANKKATSGVVHDSNIKVINGSIKAGTASIINLNHTSSATEVKSFNFTFEDVTFGIASENCSGYPFITNSQGAGAGVNINADFVNCTFDYSTVPSQNIILFNMTRGTDTTSSNIAIYGGKIISNAAAISKITWITSSSNDSVLFKRDASGNYTALVYPTADTPTVKTFPTDAGNMYFVEQSEDADTGMSTYVLMSYKTPYGTATAKDTNLSAIDYPFFVFSNGTYYGAFTTWKGAVNKAKELSATEGVGSQIVMRRDYSTANATDSGTNFNTAKGMITVDLGGYTLTSGSAYIIDVYVNYTTAGDMLSYASSITFKNGTMVAANVGKNGTSSLPAMGFGGTGTTTSYGKKTYNFTYDNVTFRGVGDRAIMKVWDHTFQGLVINVEMNGCTFDFDGMTKDKTLFGFKSGKTYTVCSVQINGGKVLADSVANYSLYTLDSDDNAIIGRGADGTYMTLVQLTESAAPTTQYKNAAGLVLSYGKDKTEGTKTVYLLGEPIYTEYGYIPFMYQSAADYPFAVFDEKGNLIAMAPYFYGENKADSAIGMAKDYMMGNIWTGTTYGDSPRAAFILMRRDYTFIGGERYDNLAQFQGNVTIDLGGYTLSGTMDRVIFPTTIKPWGGSGDAAVFPTGIHMKNGSVLIGNKALIEFAVWTGSVDSVEEKHFTFDFENITFGYLKGGRAASLITAYATNSASPTAIGNTWLNFDGCTFDMTNAPEAAVIFNNDWQYVNNTVTVKGGEIISDGYAVLYKENDANKSTVTFEKDADGYYTAFILPVGAELPAEKINGGALVFCKIDETQGFVTYRLRQAEVADIDFTPRASLTLDRDLVFNVYVPKTDILKSFTFDGKEYADLSSIETVNLDGNDYYLIKTPLASAEAARELKLTASIVDGETVATVSFTFSTVKYAKKLIASGSETEAKLARDVLSYIRAAYVYFGSEDASVITAIDAIIGKDYDNNNLPALDGSTDAPEAGLKAVTFVLGATPAIRFYLPSDADASLYKFYIGGESVYAVKGSDKDGDYLEIDVYAYAMCETVTYTIGGEEQGSYNIASYAAYAKTLGDEALENLVLRFAKYCESAAEYRNEVIG